MIDKKVARGYIGELRRKTANLRKKVRLCYPGKLGYPNDTVQDTIRRMQDRVKELEIENQELRQAFVLDITERMEAEKAIQEKTLLIDSLINTLPDLIFFRNNDCRYEVVNRAYVNFFQLQDVNVIGKTLEEVRPCDASTICRDTHDQVIVGKVPILVEHSRHDENGNLHIFETRKFPIFDEYGNVRTVGGISRDITERKQNEDIIRRTLHEKELLLREIHHRVKNNLATIQGLLRIHARSSKNEEFSRMVEQAEQRICSMTLAHELLYQSDNFAFVSSKSYLTKLLEHLNSSFIGLGSGITIDGKIDDCELGIDTAIPLGLIMTELVSNCIKHAFPDAGAHEIRVLFECTEKNFKLSVMDDGAGIPSNIDIQESKSMGLDLIKIFVRQLNGNLEIKRENGTHASIVFPAN